MTSLQFWLYLSSSELTRGDCDFQVQHIVNVSKRKNAELTVTGALIFSGARFLQHIEGPVESVVLIREAIMTDPRHSHVMTLAEGGLQDRAFDGWALAYGGRSQFMESAITKALRRFDESADDGTDDFQRLLKVFA